MEPVRCFIALGSNLGDRHDYLHKAVAAIESEEQVQSVRLSTIVETDPLGGEDQPRYLNAVAEIETTLPPQELLRTLLGIEKQLGRTREKRWGSRTIDLDILTYGDQSVHEAGLTIPHPELSNRPFLLRSIQELKNNG